jgi:NTP pyrophosphatase (non-canonical NTP hydrolase)
MSREIAVFLADILIELQQARAKFPKQSRITTALALVEEVGEVAKAILQDLPEEELYKECIQTAVMALRIMNDTTR